MATRATGQKFWLGVVSREHALIGKDQGFTQACHGKSAPIARMKKGDGFVQYSPKEHMKAGDTVQRFTAIGYVREGTVYQVDMGRGFKPYRIDIDYLVNQEEAQIRPLLDQLSFTADKGSKWGAKFRFGFFEITRADFDLISANMGIGAEKV
jgi:hypothetical protein